MKSLSNKVTSLVVILLALCSLVGLANGSSFVEDVVGSIEDTVSRLKVCGNGYFIPMRVVKLIFVIGCLQSFRECYAFSV